MEAEPIWKTIWKLSVPERVKCFAWQIAHGRLPTNKMISRWTNSAPYCFHCTDTEESILHVLRDCNLAVMVWNHLLPIEAKHLFFVGDFKEWVNFNLITTGWRIEQSEWKNVWATTCYFLWQWRNKAVHDDTFQRPFHPSSKIMQYVHEYQASAISGIQTNAGQSVAIQVRWMCPQQGYFCLNTDGAVKKGSQQAVCGGVIRNDNGNWVCGFAKALSPCSAFIAELWGIFEGIMLAKDRNIMKMEVQVDSKAVLQCLTGSKTDNICGRSLVRKIRELIGQGVEVQFKHVYREANKVADWLANLGCNLTNENNLFEFPPREVQLLVVNDVMGVSTSRMISV